MNLDMAQIALSAEQLGASSHCGNMLDGRELTYSYEPAYSYDELFPSLPEMEGRPVPEAPQVDAGQWNQKMKLKTSVITQVFHVPVEERRFREISSQRFGEQGEQAKICADIMQKTGAHIEISSSKDQSLTILVTGKEEAVMKARQKIVSQLQTQASITIQIPREHYRFILGKNRKKLADLELNTATKITIPRPEDNSDLIKITGTKEGIDKARHEIQVISDEQAKMAFERLDIPRIYHPFIAGPHNETVNQLVSETGTRINMPPPNAMKYDITIAGEKEAVSKAKERILKIYDEKKIKCQMVSVEVKKNQHKYIIGPRGQTIHEIMAQTGVSVEMPPLDSDSDTITLRGEQDKLGPALTLVYAKANSVKTAELSAPSWLHKFIIGRKGANIRQITQDLPKVHVEFNNDQDKIKVEGPPEDVEKACLALSNVIKDLQARVAHEEVCIEPQYHRHIIGKSGANINRLKEETGVLVNIPSDNEGSNIIKIEGSPEGVLRAKQELLDMVHKMKNEVSKELIIEQRFHRTIIGTKGEKIKEIRDQFNQVNITFPEHGIKSDKVIIRGPKDDVEKCYKYLYREHENLVVNNHKIDVPIYKQFHKFIIGKGGANIRKIRDETNTKIDLPAEGSESEVIIITGKKENVLAAKERILEIQNELENVIQVDILIPFKFHNYIIGSKGRLIRSIMDECGGVTIQFPKEGSGSDKVTIRGIKEDVTKAKKQLLELASEKELTSFSDEVKAKPEHHKFLIGKNGANVKKVREKTGARILFPTDKDSDRESIIIMGRKEEVMLARKELEEMINDLNELVKDEIHVDPKYHRHFVARRGEVLQQIADDFGGVTVSFPRSGTNSDAVTLKGYKEDVEGAKRRIQEIVSDLQSMVTVECIIPQHQHRTVMGTKGHKVQNITTEYNVQIKFPERERDVHQNDGEVTLNGEASPHSDGSDLDRPKKGDIITITGKEENCNAAKQALLDLVPVTLEIIVPNDLHRYIIGQKGRDVRDMMERFDVNITIPPVNSQDDYIKIYGSPANAEAAKSCLLERVQQLEEEKQDRLLRSFRLTLEVDPLHHPKIIGRKGAVISKIREEHKVLISFPDRDSSNENQIVITGYEENAKLARDDILKIVREQEELYREEVEIDQRAHSRLIGSRGRNIRKIMDQFKVDIRFPQSSDDNKNLVVISGMEDNVIDAKECLLNLEEEYIQDLTEKQMLQSRQPESDAYRPRGENKGFVVKGGPWEQSQQAPDTSNTQEFPSFGSGDVPKPVIWGPRR